MAASSDTTSCPSPNTQAHQADNRECLMNDVEVLAPAARYVRDYGDLDDMGELSDSPSSLPSRSRPATPSSAILVTSADSARAVQSRSPFSGHSTVEQQEAQATANEPLALAHKAERILGLVPGTLAHAHACLENARDEVRRTALATTAGPSYLHPDGSVSNNPSGSAAGLGDRAARALSMVLPRKHPKLEGVVLGAGGEEEEERREKRRRAVDGVLHWQKEVARLEAEEREAAMTTKRRGSVKHW